MRAFYLAAKKFILCITSFLAGIFLFIGTISLSLSTTVMDSDFHGKLFEKNNIYTEVHNEVNDLLHSIFTDYNNSPQLNEQQQEIFYVLQESISPKMVRTNLDSIREGLFKYFRGDINFLPDIRLDTDSLPQDDTPQDVSAKKGVSSLETSDPDQVLSKIKRVSLSAILRSINRSDILDRLLSVKLLYFVMDYIPKISVLVVAVLFILSLLLCKKSKEMVKWLFGLLITSSFFNLIDAIAGFVLCYKIIPENINTLTMLIPLKSEVILSYLQDCILPISLYSMALSILIILISFAVLSSSRIVNKVSLSNIFRIKIPEKYLRIIEYSTLAVLFVLFAGLLSFEVYSFKKEFISKNFTNVISKLTNANAYTEVVSAKDDTIYTLQIKLVNTKDNSPVPGIQINVSGKTEIPEKYHNLTDITDETGSVKFTLGKGTFRLEFSSYRKPPEYVLPSPFLFDLQSVGTTIVTVNLDECKETGEKTGITEIEFLNEDNLPVEKIELYVDNTNQPAENEEPSFEESGESSRIPDKYYSITNEEGIAVLKLPEGFYNVTISPDKFPKDYIIPESLAVNCSADITARYTIRLVRKQTETPSPQN
ncbi:MAG TPA: hypothetical protein PLA01_00640 [Acetivibrio sp.]|nr:hypothetical protein [Acetivibrio sp.]